MIQACQSSAKTCLNAARDDLGNMCPDCYRITVLGPLIAEERRAQQALSIVKARVKVAADRLASVSASARNGNGDRHVIHKCICGFMHTDWMTVNAHVEDSTDSSLHRHADRVAGNIPKPRTETISYCVCGHQEISHKETDTGWPCALCPKDACVDFEFAERKINRATVKPTNGAPRSAPTPRQPVRFNEDEII